MYVNIKSNAEISDESYGKLKGLLKSKYTKKVAPVAKPKEVAKKV
jgi:hypothetical protein